MNNTEDVHAKLNDLKEQKPSTIIETDDWKLGCFIEWRPKSHREECPQCYGKGEIGGGFKDLNDPHECPMCFGRGSINEGPRTQQPELPEALVEHMRRAWWDFLNTNEQNQKLSAGRE